MFDFEATVVDVFNNVLEGGKRNLVILDQSAFYPTSGGQANDLGTLKFEGDDTTYNVIDVIKVGKVTMHKVDQEVAEDTELKGKKVEGSIDQGRRAQLQAHHTGTHLVFASARNILGPHIWQAGAKKTEKKAHLDITHFKGLTKQ